ncbi:substrate-binding domain-containing protein [Chamaesiphon sp. VAR_69_metabat_338]|uniref:substrate-binding domain-containing protein n=1 Tax=Chamaesiphon sp. VAR_69_metabat_338 TaxID=2964704 RepID=UPI00286DA96E|nr:substrate-binding domain-containing protein [Chamaesiphon sp. VAR_69_metabat_338]
MTSKKGLPPIVYIAGSLALAGLGYAVYNKLNTAPAPIVTTGDRTSTTQVAFDVPSTVPTGTIVKIGGATSMVQFNKALKTGFEQKFPGVQALTLASSSNRGLADVAAGTIDITGVSRELTAADKDRGLVAVPIIKDKIAIVVGKNNAFTSGLTSAQVAKIFTGEIKNWSEVGGKSLPIRPILRPIDSGTHQSFQDLGLQEKNFGSGGNFKVLERDATTPLLQALGNDGIGYATYAQVANQSTVRVMAIDGATPELSGYPYRRTLAYVYKHPPNDAVKAFLGFTTSREGKELISQQSQNK